MAEKLPYLVFDSPLIAPPLTEAPSLLGARPSRETTINAYNKSLALLLQRQQIVEQRRLVGGFNTLGLIAEKSETGGTLTVDEIALVRDFRTLIDANDAKYGRRNLNAARHIETYREAEAKGMALNPQEEKLRLNYQSGNFHLILSEDHPLDRRSSIDRFVVPIRKGDKTFAFIDGAPVDGLIRELDRRIAEAKERGDLYWFEKSLILNNLRHKRDVLYTSSSPLVKDNNTLTHARKQYEAWLKSEHPLLSEWEKPDWYKSELMLRDRRVLDLQRKGRNRWPLLLLIPLAALPLLWPKAPAPVILPAPVTVNANPCFDVAGGQLRIEAFDLTKDPNPSIRGANQREMAYQRSGLSQQEFKPSSDAELIAKVAAIEAQDPGYAGAYLQIAEQDELQTAQRIRGDQSDNPWLEGTDFAKGQKVVASCLSPEQRAQKAMEVISQNR